MLSASGVSRYPKPMNPELGPEQQTVITATQVWLERAVIGLGLCPFAKAVHIKGQIRYVVSEARTEDALCSDLASELNLLMAADPASIDTTLLIHPRVLQNFLDYNDFLSVANEVLERLELDGELQIASFHPQYRFAGNTPEDIANYVNRSPYPMLHLLREDSVDRAVLAFPDASLIYNKNIETMRALGHPGWRRLFEDNDSE
jgi:hypothetical protein